MEGLKIALFRIIPFALLISFVCFGIEITFGQQLTNLTYLNAEHINGIYMYTFNWKAYVENINPQTLTDSLATSIDTTTYMSAVNSFSALWDNGYDLGDILRTIVNALIIVIDTISLIINLLLIPVRLICGLLLIGISLLGININANTPIITVLSTLRDVLSITMIQPWTT